MALALIDDPEVVVCLVPLGEYESVHGKAKY